MGKRNRTAVASARPSTPSTDPFAPTPWKWILGLTLLAFAVRIPFLGRSDLWVDELLFMWDSQLPMSPFQVWALHFQKFPSIGHLPFGAMLHNAFLHLSGQDPGAVQYNPLLQRMPAMIQGTLSVPLLYLAARRIAGETTGRITGVLFAVAFFPVFYSREAYYYAPLMFLSCATLLAFSRAMYAQDRRWWRWPVLTLVMAATVMTHISGVMLPLSFLLTGLFMLVRTYVHTPAGVDVRDFRSRIGMTIAVSLLSTSPLIPFLVRRMQNPGMQQVGGAPDWWIILFDLIGKCFAGVMPVPFAIGALVFAAGALVAFRAPGQFRHVAAVSFVLIALITIGSLRSQYSARYFTVASPYIYLVFAAGFHAVARLASVKSETRALRIASILVMAFSAVQLVLFHRVAYQLEAKSRHYGGMARWVNENVPAGSGYLLESGYDVRFLGQYHQTPQKTPVILFIHSSAADVERLRAMQQVFMQQHPDVPFVEAARHGTEFNANVPVWTWPHSFYRKRYDLWNHPLQTLVKRGIWPQIHAAGMPDIEYHTVIWYNTDEDCREILREQGRKARFDFLDGWNLAQVAQGVYMNAHQPSRARIICRTVDGQAVGGTLRVAGAVAAREPINVRLEQEGKVVAAARWLPGSVQELTVPGFSMTGHTGDLWLVSDLQKQSMVQAILVDDISLE